MSRRRAREEPADDEGGEEEGQTGARRTKAKEKAHCEEDAHFTDATLDLDPGVLGDASSACGPSSGTSGEEAATAGEQARRERKERAEARKKEAIELVKKRAAGLDPRANA